MPHLGPPGPVADSLQHIQEAGSPLTPHGAQPALWAVYYSNSLLPHDLCMRTRGYFPWNKEQRDLCTGQQTLRDELQKEELELFWVTLSLGKQQSLGAEKSGSGVGLH